MEIKLIFYEQPLQRFPIIVALNACMLRSLNVILWSKNSNKTVQHLIRLMPDGSRCCVLPAGLNFISKSFLKVILENSFIRKMLSKLSIYVTILKSTPYHEPRVIGPKVNVIYFGDGIGCLDDSGRLPWYPKMPDICDNVNKKQVALSSFVLLRVNSAYKSTASWHEQQIYWLKKLLAKELISLKLRFNEKAEHQQIEHVVFLSLLRLRRTSRQNEMLLMREYFSTKITLSSECSRIMLVFHPTQENDFNFKQEMQACLKSLYYNHTFVSPGIKGDYAFLSEYSAEQIYMFLMHNSNSGSYSLKPHLFQSSIFSFAALFPGESVFFGYGENLIKKYFYEYAASTQIQFECYSRQIVSSRLKCL